MEKTGRGGSREMPYSRPWPGTCWSVTDYAIEMIHAAVSIMVSFRGCQCVRQSHWRPPCGPSWFITQLLLGAINCTIPAADVGSCGRSGGMRPK